MAAKTAERRKVSAKIAAIQRHNGPEDPRLEGLSEELRGLTAEEIIQDLADTYPPFSEVQRARLAAILLGARRGSEAMAS